MDLKSFSRQLMTWPPPRPGRVTSLDVIYRKLKCSAKEMQQTVRRRPGKRQSPRSRTRCCPRAHACVEEDANRMGGSKPIWSEGPQWVEPDGGPGVKFPSIFIAGSVKSSSGLAHPRDSILNSSRSLSANHDIHSNCCSPSSTLTLSSILLSEAKGDS
jgi:hypothetical protein